MNISNLQHFLVLAETLNYTQAAEKCYISQPTLSRKICEMEKELGVELFQRNRKTVSITNEGRIVLEHARKICEEYSKMLFSSQLHKKGMAGTLKLRYNSYPDVLNLYVKSEAILCKKYPELSMSMTFGDIKRNLKMLMNEEIDGLFMLDCGLENYPQLMWQVIEPMQWYVIVPTTHRLACRENVRISELADERFVSPNRSIYPEIFDFRLKVCLDNGFVPHNVKYENTVMDVMLAISHGDGIAILNSTANQASTISSIKPILISGNVPSVNTSLVWKKNNFNPCLNNLISALKQVCSDENNE
ncbi:MAG: LysR family transcriptional regulator [Oscillospiraceae bacterium]